MWLKIVLRWLIGKKCLFLSKVLKGILNVLGIWFECIFLWGFDIFFLNCGVLCVLISCVLVFIVWRIVLEFVN